MIYFEKNKNGQTITLRDLQEKDILPIVNYWFQDDPTFYEKMGIDKNNFPTREARTLFFRSMIGQDPQTGNSFMLVGECEGRTVGYALFNHILRGDSCQAHLHVIDPHFRRMGVVSLFFKDVLMMVPKLLDIKRVIFEPSVNNEAVNLFIQQFGILPTTTYLKPAQGICREMTVNRYEVPVLLTF